MYRIKQFRTATMAALLTLSTGAQATVAVNANLRYAGNDRVLATHVAINGVDNYIYIGSYQIQQQGQPGSFAAYCVDPFQDVNSSYVAYERSPLVAANLPPDQTARFAAVSRLFGNAYAGSLADGTRAAGFQLALWEVWQDDGMLTTGSIRSLGSSDAGMVAEANRLLANMPGWSAGTAYDLTYYFNAAYQDYASALVLEVPEPGTYALLLAGLGMLGLARRRQRDGRHAKVTTS